MKKLILSAAIILGSFSAFAQTATTTKTVETTQSVQEKFKEITAAEVPDAVKASLKSAHTEATIEKAYINENKEYKLDVKIGSQLTTVYADAAGNWIKK